jgi:polyphosphate glucokinase
VKHFGWTGPVGCTFPAVVKDGVTLTAANVDSSWISTNAERLFHDATGCPVTIVNDADAAGIAEMRFGAEAGERGVVLVLTLGTGIGSALFVEGILVPNTEFGHIEIDGRDAEHRAAANVREERGWSWEKWAKRLQTYLDHMEKLLSPDLIIIGGGVSKKADKFLPHIETRGRIAAASLLNEAGMIGAAVLAHGRSADHAPAAVIVGGSAPSDSRRRAPAS